MLEGTACDGYIAFDYRDVRNMREVFPDPAACGSHSEQRWLRACRRECRGLLVCSRTGVVLARRFPKFFNIGELPETAPECIDLGMGFTLAEKLDGSLVSPLLLGGPQGPIAQDTQQEVRAEMMTPAAQEVYLSVAWLSTNTLN